MATLPKNFENQNQLKNMKVGQSGYIVPWGMWVDLNGNCWLNEDYEFDSTPGGTVQLKVTRVVDGYIAHIHEMKYSNGYKWTPQTGPSYASPDEVCWGEVVGFDINIIDQISQKSKQLWKAFWSKN